MGVTELPTFSDNYLWVSSITWLVLYNITAAPVHDLADDAVRAPSSLVMTFCNAHRVSSHTPKLVASSPLCYQRWIHFRWGSAWLQNDGRVDSSLLCRQRPLLFSYKRDLREAGSVRAEPAFSCSWEQNRPWQRAGDLREARARAGKRNRSDVGASSQRRLSVDLSNRVVLCICAHVLT